MNKYIILSALCSTLIMAHGGVDHSKAKQTHKSANKATHSKKMQAQKQTTATKQQIQSKTTVPKELNKTKVSPATTKQLTKSPTQPKVVPIQKPKITQESINKQINTEYITNIKPIFQTKCFACHATNSKTLPWYYGVPGVKQLMDYDMEEAKNHLNFDDDFPFISHASPLLDLKGLKKSVAERDMPPLRYRVIHWDSLLDANETKILNSWVDNSIEMLGTLK